MTKTSARAGRRHKTKKSGLLRLQQVQQVAGESEDCVNRFPPAGWSSPEWPWNTWKMSEFGIRRTQTERPAGGLRKRGARGARSAGVGRDLLSFEGGKCRFGWRCGPTQRLFLFAVSALRATAPPRAFHPLYQKETRLLGKRSIGHVGHGHSLRKKCVSTGRTANGYGPRKVPVNRPDERGKLAARRCFFRPHPGRRQFSDGNCFDPA